MASKAVMDAVSARLSANWTATAIVDPNTAGEPPADGSAFLTVQYPVANEEHISLGQPGGRLFREEGGIRFVLAVPRGIGVEQALAWMDGLRLAFRAAQFAGVTCQAAPPPAIDDENDQGGMYRLRLVVLYYFDLLA